MLWGEHGTMRAVRLVIAVLTALALAIPPVSAGVAMQPVAKAEMTMSGHACDGADIGHDQGTDACKLRCCASAAILVEAQPLASRHRMSAAELVATALVPFTLPPDPPPPRS